MITTQMITKMKVYDLTQKFGIFLSTRDKGRDAYAVIIHEVIPSLEKGEKLLITIKHTDEAVITPSFLDETVIELYKRDKNLVYVDSKVDEYIKDTLAMLAHRSSVQLNFV